MKKIKWAVVAVCLLSAVSVSAADVKKTLTLESARSSAAVQEILDGDIAMYWGNQSHPAVSKKIGVYKTSKRTNGFMKADEDACARALASALIVFQERARKEGGNAVLGLVSNIKNVEESSETEYRCLVGSVMVNVALKGTVVKLAK
ncbi:hypothetical protein [Desulforhopalus singaporensis]|uniref:Excinuclease ABC subunit A n=1 Tax=Desulforhopalus singaporensis TaxID=91360 RepID=A0A1H0T4Y9_9BACT|nr:hypothetical protein [Desulforhopalus singaporensis]SDP49004.1 hypothetical protein SAMN05660330_02927 [Desulforhopalus singaporensis]